ncbi:DNA-3-methyladenine glycosylase family protein [Luteipulveratus flavus]|nr:DNA-3-methyladenine glycosylase 2 family protein [Luteipulveratus sp. YIM 133296]
MSGQPTVRVWAPGRPVPMGAILSGLRHGGYDPTWRTDASGLWRASRTPDGPVTMHLTVARADVAGDAVTARAWGPGASWLLDRLPAMLGDGDDTDGFVPEHPVLATAHRRAQHFRVPCSGLVMESLIPVVIEQRVTGKQAFAGYRSLVRRYGETAPGPGGELRLVVPPDVRTWRRVPSWEWLRAGVDAARADTVARALSVAARLEECADLPIADAHRRLRAVPGIGAWTAAEVAQRALGDADAVSVGDYHVAKNVTYALDDGRVGDDARMLELLQPYAGHRFRVQRLLELAGIARPRRGPRLTVPTHLPA